MCTFPYDFRLFLVSFVVFRLLSSSTYGYKQCISDFMFVFLSFFIIIFFRCASFAIQLIQCFLFRDDVLVKLLLDYYFLFGAFFENWVHPWFIYDSAICIMIAHCSAIEPYSHTANDIVILLQQHTTDMIIFFMFPLIFYFIPFHIHSLFLCLHYFFPFDVFQFFISSVVKFGYKNW